MCFFKLCQVFLNFICNICSARRVLAPFLIERLQRLVCFGFTLGGECYWLSSLGRIEWIREQGLLPDVESDALLEKQLALPTPYVVALSRFSGGDVPSLEPVVS